MHTHARTHAQPVESHAGATFGLRLSSDDVNLQPGVFYITVTGTHAETRNTPRWNEHNNTPQVGAAEKEEVMPAKRFVFLVRYTCR